MRTVSYFKTVSKICIQKYTKIIITIKVCKQAKSVSNPADLKCWPDQFWGWHLVFAPVYS